MAEFYDADAVFVNFSIAVDYENFKEIALLKKDGKTVQIESSGAGRCFAIKPIECWKKGCAYTFSVDGALKTCDNRTYTVHEVRHFVYGKENNFLMLTQAPHSNLLTADEEIVFKFSKAVLHSSFLSAFSLSPYLETNVLFSDDGCTVRVQPILSWPCNTIFTWKIDEELIALDGYKVEKSYAGMLTSLEDTVLPELVCVQPAVMVNNTYLLIASGNLNTLIDKQPIGFVFSKTMDIDSVEKNISFSPNISGAVHVVDEKCTTFVFVPYTIYDIETPYELTVGKGCIDEHGLSLYEEKKYFFTGANKFIRVTSIKACNTELLGATVPPIVPMPVTKYITAEIAFSTAIPNARKELAEKAISSTLVFPLSASNPQMISMTWNFENTIAIITWMNYTSSNTEKNYYQIKIKGGKTGVVNEVGEYIKEDVCVTFIAGDN
ncbi:MAG: hypothetical protein J6I73_04135 [Treponema sp.]|nr:hypothetical protein [Treponema sp.]